MKTGRRRRYNWLRISPLHEAARKGDVPEAKKLLEAGADLTARDEHLRSTPLAWAAKFGQLEMVKFLLGRGAPKSLPDDPDMGHAARVGNQARARRDRETSLLRAACPPGRRKVTCRRTSRGDPRSATSFLKKW